MHNYTVPPRTNTAGGRRFVVADIHGSALTLKAMVEEKLGLTKGDQLFLLGDYIDRGNSNREVLDYIISLRQNNYKVYPLRGNHEQMLLDAWSRYTAQAATSRGQRPFSIEAADLLDGSGNLADAYITFLVSLPHYFELDHFYLVHAGINFEKAEPFEDQQSMLWMRNPTQNPTSKTIIFGHEITSLREIKYRIRQKSAIIPLDNGCYYGSKSRNYRGKDPEIDLGNLCALDLDTMELLVQENVD